MNSSAERIWDTFWTVAAAISGLGLPGAFLLLMVCYLVVFLRWICRDSSFGEALLATKPGRRRWLKVTLAAGAALFVLNLPLCTLEVARYGLFVASAVCVVAVFSRSLREATRIAHWPFWLLAASLAGGFDFLLWAYCRSGATAAGLESFFPFMELLLLGAGYFLYFRVPETKTENLAAVAKRVALCVLALLAIEHSCVQASYFLAYRNRRPRLAEQIEARSSYLPVSEAMRWVTEHSPPRPTLSAVEEKGMRARVDFEEDLARVIAFFFGFLGFNSIFVVASRHFGLRDAKSVPQLARLARDGLASVPEVPETVRRSVFFPDRQYRRGHRAQLLVLATVGNFFVSAITTFSTSKGGLGQFALSFVAYSGMLLPPILLGCSNGFRVAAYRARSSLHGVRILMHTPGYVPIDVTVRRPTFLQTLHHRITGAWIRHAVDGEGRLYSLMFGHCPPGEFPAHLYRLRSGPLNESLTGRQAYVAIPRNESVNASDDPRARCA